MLFFSGSRRSYLDSSRTMGYDSEKGARSRETTPVRSSYYTPGQLLFNSSAQHQGHRGSLSPLDGLEDDSAVFPSPPAAGRSRDFSDLCSLVQEQQHLLRTLISGQEKLKEGQEELKLRQDETDKRLVEIEEKTSLFSDTSSESNNEKKRKKRIPKDLTVCYCLNEYVNIIFVFTEFRIKLPFYMILLRLKISYVWMRG